MVADINVDAFYADEWLFNKALAPAVVGLRLVPIPVVPAWTMARDGSRIPVYFLVIVKSAFSLWLRNKRVQ